MAVSEVRWQSLKFRKEATMSQRSPRHFRLVRRLSVTLAVLVACSQDPTGSGTGGLPRSPALVSAPVTGAPGGAAGLRLGVAYVSMRPGTDPAGVSVTVRNGPVGPRVDAAMVDGGFDPIAIAAEAGDTLLITVHRSDGTSAAGYAVVAARTRPVVVRISPPNHKTDVVLNSVITVIFTQPMDSASLPGALHLRVAGAEVAGTVTVSAAGGGLLSAVFVPASPLAPRTTYQFEVSTAALGQNGEPLATPVQVSFTTGLSCRGRRDGVHHPSLSIVVGGQTPMVGDPTGCVGHAGRRGLCLGHERRGRGHHLEHRRALGAQTRHRRDPGHLRFRLRRGHSDRRAGPVGPGVRFGERRHVAQLRGDDGGVTYCWGDNGAGELGDGVRSMYQSSTPVPVTGGLTFATVSAAWDRHTCGVTTGGAAYCWGSDGNGDLGIGAATLLECAHSGRGRSHLHLGEYRVTATPAASPRAASRTAGGVARTTASSAMVRRSAARHPWRSRAASASRR